MPSQIDLDQAAEELPQDAFTEAIRRSNNADFTLASIEFEKSLSRQHISAESVWGDQRLRKVLGTYLACCCMVGREPLLQHVVVDPRVKGDVMTIALEAMKKWESDPASRLIAFVRRIT